MPKLTTKRQVTIPASICEKMGLQPGDSIQVFERDGVAHLVKMSEDDLAGALQSSKPQCNKDDLQDVIKSAVKEKAAKKYRPTI